MNQAEIKIIIDDLSRTKDRNVAIIDFGNVEKWRESLGWPIGIKQLAQLVKNFCAKKPLRKFYYGSDFGPQTKSQTLNAWSKLILEKARNYGFDVITKRVKYVLDSNYKEGFAIKCDFDIQIAIDLIKEIDNYDKIILFSGDGDFACLLRYLKEKHNKNSIVFGARNHVGAEIFDLRSDGIIDADDLLYAEDFEYRLNFDRFKR